jgi:hypothetical protein
MKLVDDIVREANERHKGSGLDDLSHYMDMCAVLGAHARTLEEHNRLLLTYFEGKPGTKRPFADALANEVIHAQVKRITELEGKVISLQADLEASRLREAEYRQYLPSGDD